MMREKVGLGKKVDKREDPVGEVKNKEIGVWD